MNYLGPSAGGQRWNPAWHRHDPQSPALRWRELPIPGSWSAGFQGGSPAAVALIVDFDAQPRQVTDDELAHHCTALANPAGKGNPIHTPERHQERARLSGRPVAKCSMALPARRFVRSAAVHACRNCARKGPEVPNAGRAISSSSSTTELPVALQRQQNTRINRPTTRAHHQAIQRRIAHGGRDTAAVANRRGAAPIAEMEYEQPRQRSAACTSAVTVRVTCSKLSP